MTDDSFLPLAKRYGTNNGRWVVLYAGTFEPYQGLNLLVDASQAIIHAQPSVRFLCIGGNQMQIESIKARAHQHGVIEYFLFLVSIWCGYNNFPISFDDSSQLSGNRGRVI